MTVHSSQNIHLFAAMMCAVLAAEMTSSHAWLPIHRMRRRFKPEEPLRLRAMPHDVTLYPGASVSVRCRVRVASWALHNFHVGFYMYYDADTTLPIASNIPGVTVRPWSVSRSSFKHELDPSIRRSRYVTIGRLLTIGWPTYRYIPHGTNLFSCQASTVVNVTREDMDKERGSGDVNSDVILKPTRKFYTSFFRVHKIRF